MQKFPNAAIKLHHQFHSKKSFSKAKPFKKLWLCAVARPCYPDLPDQSHQLMMMQWCMPSFALIILLASGRVSAGSPSWSLTAGPLQKIGVSQRRVHTPAETRVCSRTRAAQRSINWDSVFRGKGWICEPTWNAFLTFAHFFTWGIPVIQYVFAIDYPLEQESARRNPTVPYSNWHGTNP